MRIKTIKQKTVVEQVLSDVKQLIANGTFPVGEKFPSEPDLATMFGIGRSSVREAVKILQFLGILELRPSKGTYVCANTNLAKEVLSWTLFLGKKDFMQLIELRKSIEKSSLENLINMKNISEKSWKYAIENLEKCYDDMVNANTTEMFINSDYKFHGSIIEASGNSVFENIYLTLKSFMYEEIKYAFESIDRDHLDVLHSEHAEILKSIKERCLDDAVIALNNHITQIELRLNKSLHPVNSP